MSGVVLATDSPDLFRVVEVAAGPENLTAISTSQVPVGPAQLMSFAADPTTVRTVILDGGEDGEERMLRLASRMKQTHPLVGIILVTPHGEKVALAALRSGIHDVLAPDAPVEDVRWTLRRVNDMIAAVGTDPDAPEPFAGRVIVVTSPKGGVGKTTIATNIAAMLAQESSAGVVLLDLDIQFGDVAAALNLQPTHTLADALSGPVSNDPIALKSILTLHPCGMHVVPGVDSPVEADKIEARSISQLIATLKGEFRYVVVDTSPGLAEATLAAIDHATDLVLVTGLDVPGGRGMRKQMEVLAELELQEVNLHLVVNMADRSGGLSVADLAATLSRKADVVLPRSNKVALSTNVGEPLVLARPRDQVSRALASLVSRFAPLGSTGRSGRHRRLAG